MIYLDSAATSLHKPPQVIQAVCHAMTTFGNEARGAHAGALEAARCIFQTRKQLANLFQVGNPQKVAFTYNATHSLNIAIHGLVGVNDHVITTVAEHNSVLRPLYRKRQEGTQISLIGCDAAGRLCYEQLERERKPNTKAVICTHASNVTGNVTDLEIISQFCKKYGLLLIVDASQTAGAIPISMAQTGIDVLCFTGHKSLLGPQGTGGICVREGLNFPGLCVGGTGVHSFDENHPTQMPTALEAGTLNGHGIAGLHEALRWIEETGVENIQKREADLTRMFWKGVEDIPGVLLYGDFDAPVRAPIVSLNVKDYSSQQVCDQLSERYQIAVRGGAHCAPQMHKNLGTVQQGVVRFSFSYFTTECEIEQAVTAIKKIAEE